MYKLTLSMLMLAGFVLAGAGCANQVGPPETEPGSAPVQEKPEPGSEPMDEPGSEPMDDAGPGGSDAY